MSIDGNKCNEDFYEKAKEYWDNVTADMDGMLGGLSYVNKIDFQSSRAFLKSQIQKIRTNNPEIEHLKVLDCGAGIGRVSKYVLGHYFDEIHLLEQCSNFVEQSKEYLKDIDDKVTHRYCQGIQEFEPLENVKYDCIWNQWVIGHITDEDLKTFLDVKCYQILQPHGFVMIKDNIMKGEQSFEDVDDSSFTRTYEAYMKVLSELENFRVDRVVKQKDMPSELLPVRMFVLVPK